MSDVLLRSATLPDGTVADVTLTDGRIASVRHPADNRHHTADVPAQTTEYDLSGFVLLPAPAEPHAHLDKALTADLVPNPDGTLVSAITNWIARYPERTVEEIFARARQAALANLAAGCTAIRTHVDINYLIETRAIEAVLRVKAELADLIDVQIVGLAGRPTSGEDDGPRNRAMLEKAIELGIDVVGAAPHIDPDPAWVIDYCLRLAADARLPVDLHVDENLDPNSHDLDMLARGVLDLGFEHGATASHCVALGIKDEQAQRKTALAAAEADVSVITLPQTNLFLQARGQRCSPPRGLTAIAGLLDAGVNVAGGADNLQDPFNTVGRGDPLETAALLVMAAHLDVEQAYHLVSNASRRALGLPQVNFEPGDPAELLAVRGRTLREVVAFAPQDRLVFHRGCLVARSTTSVEITPPA